MASDHSRSTQIQLAERPKGWPDDATFRTVAVDLPELGEGEVRVANDFVSVDPYMRGRMDDVKSYVPPYALGETMEGGAVGRVVESASERLAVGDLVLHSLGWRDMAQAEASAFRRVEELPDIPASVYLGVLGMPGFTAWVGLRQIARMREGDIVFVSGAAGAVGSAVGQIARLAGASRVIGSAGSEEKVRTLTERYGFDAAINYKDGPVRSSLREAAPDGIDVYFDNVGGEHLEAALGAFRDGGRGAICGMISQYNATEPAPGPRNLANLIKRGLTLQGFTVNNYNRFFGDFASEVTPWVRSGELVFDETVVDGIENAPTAFLDMMHGANIGKMVVRV
ncbi:NADP-dependent oxidoreductase [Salinibacterium sp. SYSU T00001]|uniref:NADP-dependent oxidoreductase n=1 Tax=Homoserinimonas sedimenticola TaxID=2986805 RepID=UPI0022360402|nr:NADP-dependent oxidoreductase [Salinibacterium sedimenticola]MCW4384228.1 NADP-dependent oxidoreductase [Salinibacterium sedimenticola]